MSGILSTLMGGIDGVLSRGVGIYDTISQRRAEEKLAEAQIQEYRYLEAQERRAAAEAAATSTQQFLDTSLLKNIAMWGLTTIAGGVLLQVVLKTAGFTK